MKDLLTGREMKRCDDNTIQHFGMSSQVLMERAALAVYDEMKQRDLLKGKIGIFCGTGNNGGDGIALARLLHLKGCQVTYAVCGNKSHMSKECRQQYDIAGRYQVRETENLCEVLQSDVLVDCLFGIGLSRNIEGDYCDWIEAWNNSDAYKIAVDIPSGVSADDGTVMGVAASCDLTVTFSFGKVGLYLLPGAKYCGQVVVRDVGITKESLLDYRPQFAALDEEDLNWLKEPRMDLHKGTAGKLLVVAGSTQMAGAAYLSAKAAYRMGCGMVKIYTPACNHGVLQSLIPEAIIVDYEKKPASNRLLEEMKWADVILVGPGLGTSEEAKSIVSYVIRNAAVPVVCDADALNLLAEDLSLLRGPHTELILTPHLGEMSRLTGESILYLKDHFAAVAMDFAAEYHVTCVLKGARTVTSVPYHKTYINTSGNAGMATAGSGDVLAGIIAGSLLQGIPVNQAAAFGVYLHGKAGDEARRRKGIRSVMATDIIDGISEVLRKEEQIR